MFALGYLIRIAFLLRFGQITLTLGYLIFLLGDFFLMVGAQFAVSTICPNFAQRFVQTIDAVLIVVLFGIAYLPLNILFFFLTEGGGVTAGTESEKTNC